MEASQTFSSGKMIMLVGCRFVAIDIRPAIVVTEYRNLLIIDSCFGPMLLGSIFVEEHYPFKRI